MNAAAFNTIQVGKGWFPEESGGLDRYFRELVTHLPEAGVSVAGLVAGSSQVAIGSRGAVRAFASNQASLTERWRAVRTCARRMLAERPGSLFVSHFALYAAPCLTLLRDAPFVVHFHGPWSDESRAEGAGPLVFRVKHWLEHVVYHRATRFIALSRAFARVLEERHGVPRERIAVIPGGVDTRRWAPTTTRLDARRQLGWPVDRPIVLVVRRLVRRMGLERLLDGVREAVRRVPDLLLLVAGRGPLGPELDGRAAALGLSRNVRLLGFIADDDLPLAYRAADLSIVPSIALEGFGLVVAESMAAGTPVLVTAVGGLPETLEGFFPDGVVQDARPEALGAALADAIGGTLGLPSADACVRYARARFDWVVVAERIRAVYHEASR